MWQGEKKDKLCKQIIFVLVLHNASIDYNRWKHIDHIPAATLLSITFFIN